MKTVNNTVSQPRSECWAFENGDCSILTECLCKKKKCSHYQTKTQHAAGVKKAQARLEKLGISVGKKNISTQKNNRVSGN